MIMLPDPPIEYNSTLIAADELGTFIHKYDKEMADGLSEFYDPTPYGMERRGGEIRIKMKSPQINMLCGSTPSNLYDTLPDSAWGQGFTSRIIMVFSDERIVGDDFANITRELSSNLIHDLRHINTIHGEYKVTEEYQKLVKIWRDQGEKPTPSHPKLVHYNSRRRVNLYKLSMVSAMDKSDTLLLTRDDFNRAINWLHEAEMFMPDIFKASGGGTDSGAMDEIYHFVLMQCVGGKVCPERKIVAFAKERLPIHSVVRVIEVMIASGQLIPQGSADYRTGQRNFKVGVPDIGDDI